MWTVGWIFIAKKKIKKMSEMTKPCYFTFMPVGTWGAVFNEALACDIGLSTSIT